MVVEWGVSEKKKRTKDVWLRGARGQNQTRGSGTAEVKSLAEARAAHFDDDLGDLRACNPRGGPLRPLRCSRARVKSYQGGQHSEATAGSAGMWAKAAPSSPDYNIRDLVLMMPKPSR